MPHSLRQIRLEIQGLGIILYSPFAVAAIPPGADYFGATFQKPEDVARHVEDCQLIGFSTGSPGRFRLNLLLGEPDEAEVQAAAFKVRLGLEVRGGRVCARDLYDLIEWSPDCPESQQVAIRDGFYRLTVYSSPPPSGILGDDQAITICLEAVAKKPRLRWEGVPSLC